MLIKAFKDWELLRGEDTAPLGPDCRGPRDQVLNYAFGVLQAESELYVASTGHKELELKDQAELVFMIMHALTVAPEEGKYVHVPHLVCGLGALFKNLGYDNVETMREAYLALAATGGDMEYMIAPDLANRLKTSAEASQKATSHGGKDGPAREVMLKGEQKAAAKLVSAEVAAKDDEQKAMEMARRPKCWFGSKCYRYTITHRARISHPGDIDWKEEGEVTSGTDHEEDKEKPPKGAEGDQKEKSDQDYPEMDLWIPSEQVGALVLKGGKGLRSLAEAAYVSVDLSRDTVKKDGQDMRLLKISSLGKGDGCLLAALHRIHNAISKVGGVPERFAEQMQEYSNNAGAPSEWKMPAAPKGFRDMLNDYKGKYWGEEKGKSKDYGGHAQKKEGDAPKWGSSSSTNGGGYRHHPYQDPKRESYHYHYDPSKGNQADRRAGRW